MMQLSTHTIAYLLLGLSRSTAFTRPAPHVQPSCHSSSALHVSVVSEFLASQSNATSSSIRATFETESPESVGVKAPGIESSSENEDEKKQKRKKNKKKSKPKRKHNYSELESFLKEIPDLDFYTLHSSAVSHLYLDMPINDIM